VRLKRAGLVIFGKTHTPEFGLSSSSESRLFGATRNPWNLEYSARGSSGGSAAAIAAGMVPMAYGSDGGGSMHIPASCCELFGLKPTRARTPVGPDLGEWWSGLAIAHAITRSVRDSAALLDATSGAEIGDPYWAPPQKVGFTFCRRSLSVLSYCIFAIWSVDLWPERKARRILRPIHRHCLSQ